MSGENIKMVGKLVGINYHPVTTQPMITYNMMIYPSLSDDFENFCGENNIIWNLMGRHKMGTIKWLEYVVDAPFDKSDDLFYYYKSMSLRVEEKKIYDKILNKYLYGNRLLSRLKRAFKKLM